MKIKKTISYILAACFLLSLTGCQTQSIKSFNSVVQPQALPQDDYQKLRSIREKNPVSDTTYDALNDFAFQTAAKILVADNNNCYSPTSFYFALGMAATGAESDTLDELLAVLHAEDKNTLTQQLGNYYRISHWNDKATALLYSNSVWVRNNPEITLNQSYLDTLTKDFYAQSFGVDFTDPKTAERISQFISDQTKGLIKPNLNIKPSTALALINTLYYKDSWKNPFEKNNNTQEDFFTADGQTTKATFMHISDFTSVAKGDTFIRASLPFVSGAKMEFVLPNEGVSLSEFLSEEALTEAFTGGESVYANVNYSIPKFEIQSKYELISPLQDLGVDSAFDPNRANFSAMSDTDLYITDILQETYLDVNEEGVEAAAYTMILMTETSAPIAELEIDFVLNRPFLYAIKDPNGSILFLGICNNPTTK